MASSGSALRVQNRDRFLEHFVDRAVRVDDRVSFRLRGRQRQVTLAHAPVESYILRFEPAFVRSRARVASHRARQSDLLRQIEDQREIGIEIAGRPSIERAQLIEIREGVRSPDTRASNRCSDRTARRGPRSVAGRMISIVCCLLDAANNNTSAIGSMTFFESRRIARMRSAIGVPPGSFVVTRAFGIRSASLRTCVDFPEPSIPSNVMNTGRLI